MFVQNVFSIVDNTQNDIAIPSSRFKNSFFDTRRDLLSLRNPQTGNFGII